jgi:hypothetical protein
MENALDLWDCDDNEEKLAWNRLEGDNSREPEEQPGYPRYRLSCSTLNDSFVRPF